MSVIKLVRRGSAAASAPIVSSGLPFYGSWPAASGDWPLPWTSVMADTGGSITQNNGVGVLYRSLKDGYTATYPSTVAAADVDMRVKFNCSLSGNGLRSHLHVLARWGGGMGVGGNAYFPASCYALSYWATRYSGNGYGLNLGKYDENGAYSQLYVTSSGLTGSMWLRFQLLGSMVRIKAWDTNAPEPTTWLSENSDSTYSNAGYVALAFPDDPYNYTPSAMNIVSFAVTAPTGS